MSLTEATNQASKTAETLCTELRAVVKLADAVDPLLAYFIQKQLAEAVKTRNVMIEFAAAAKRRTSK